MHIHAYAYTCFLNENKMDSFCTQNNMAFTHFYQTKTHTNPPQFTGTKPFTHK